MTTEKITELKITELLQLNTSSGVSPADSPELLHQLLHLPGQAGGRRAEEPPSQYQGPRGDGDGETTLCKIWKLTQAAKCFREFIPISFSKNI